MPSELIQLLKGETLATVYDFRGGGGERSLKAGQLFYLSLSLSLVLAALSRGQAAFSCGYELSCCRPGVTSCNLS